MILKKQYFFKYILRNSNNYIFFYIWPNYLTTMQKHEIILYIFHGNSLFLSTLLISKRFLNYLKTYMRFTNTTSTPGIEFIRVFHLHFDEIFRDRLNVFL